MKSTKSVHIEPHEINQTSPIQPTSTTWSQWGKAAFAFTVATGAYAFSKIIGGGWGSEHTSQVSTVEQDNLPVATVPEALHLIDGDYLVDAQLSEGASHWDYPDSPLLSFSALALSAPCYPLTSLSTLGFLLIQQLDVAQAAFPAVMDLANLSPSQGCGMLGAAANDFTGYSVRHAGDVNGDGLDDVLVGANGANRLGRSDAGVAYIVFGQNDLQQADLPTSSLPIIGFGTDDFSSQANATSTDGIINTNSNSISLSEILSSQNSTQSPSSSTQSATLTQTPLTALNGSRITTVPSRSYDSRSHSQQSVTTNAVATLAASFMPQNSGDFTIITNTALFVEIGIETTITTENLAVVGFNGDPKTSKRKQARK